MSTGYLVDGSELEIVETTPSGYVIARQLYESGEGDEPIYGEAFVAERVYEAPPLEKRHQAVKELQEKADKLRMEISALHDKLTATRSRLDKIAKYPDLARLEAYLEGRLTHLVLDHYGWDIIAIEDAKCDVSDKYCKDLRLLSLMGRRGGTPEWALNRYSDGSGGHYTAHPCTSYAEAQQILQTLVDEQAVDATKGSGNIYYLEKIAAAVNKHGIAMPVGVSDLLDALTREKAAKALEDARKKFEAAQSALSLVEPVTA